MASTDSGFGPDNLPWCRFNGGRTGVRFEDWVVDIDAAGLPFDRNVWKAEIARSPESARFAACEVQYELPFEIGDYTDFYASIHHARNVGKLFRPDRPLLPNYEHLPVAYHGRASSVVVSGEPVRRPCGQSGEGRFGPTKELDYEMELGCFISQENALGKPVPISGAGSRIAGFCLVNDWSARDIQRWEYQPLGPFLGKSFATTISPWVVSPDALAPYRIPVDDRPWTLPYLRPAGFVYDIVMEAYINGKLHCRSNARHLHWTFEQMVAHHTSNGCNLRRGDLIASGTVSGPEPDAHACLLEGREPYLKDGDEVVLTAFAHRPGLPRISFGECRGKILGC